MKILLVLVIGLAFSLQSLAQSIDIKKSQLTWHGSKVIGGSFHEGSIKIKSASIKGSKGEIIIDMNSIDETTLSGSLKKKFLGHITSADFFEVKKYPTAKIKVEKIDSGYLHGEMTIKGKTQSISFPVSKVGKTYSGELGFDRTKFGLTYGSGNFFKNLGDKMISDTITVKFKIVMK